MVGQRFVTLLENHPWFQLTAIAASSALRARPTRPLVAAGPWMSPMPGRPGYGGAQRETDIDRIAAQVDFVFSAVDMKKEKFRPWRLMPAAGAP